MHLPLTEKPFPFKLNGRKAKANYIFRLLAVSETLLCLSVLNARLRTLLGERSDTG